MKNPLLSIIIPVYNSGDSVKRCLEAVCKQTYTNLEILVIYLSSEDNTLQEIKSVPDKRIRIIEQIEKTGPGGARNLGIDNANGEWIGFMEADDKVAPDFYEKLLNAAIANDCDIAQGEIIRKNKQWTVAKDGILSDFFDKFNTIINGASFDKIFKKDLIQKHNIRFAEKLRWEDNPFIFKAFYWGKIIQVKGAFYYYDSKPWADEYNQKLKNDVIPVAQEIMDFAKQCSLSEGELDLIKQKIIQSFAISFVGDKKIYQSLMDMMDSPAFLCDLRYRLIFKQFTKKIFKFNKKRKDKK